MTVKHYPAYCMFIICSFYDIVNILYEQNRNFFLFIVHNLYLLFVIFSTLPKSWNKHPLYADLGFLSTSPGFAAKPFALAPGLCYNLTEKKGGSAMRNKKTRLAQAGLLILAAGLIALGTRSGEVQTVFVKATRICMECIGLG